MQGALPAAVWCVAMLLRELQAEETVHIKWHAAFPNQVPPLVKAPDKRLNARVDDIWLNFLEQKLHSWGLSILSPSTFREHGSMCSHIYIFFCRDSHVTADYRARWEASKLPQSWEAAVASARDGRLEKAIGVAVRTCVFTMV
eukprot:3683077-Rhodomonas_salina.1